MGQGALSKPAVQWWLSLNSSIALGSVLSAVADRCDYFDRKVVVARVARGWPEHHIADVRVKARGVHAVKNLLGLLHPLSISRKAHRADVGRAVVPRVRLVSGRFCKQDFSHHFVGVEAAMPYGQAPWVVTAGVAIIKRLQREGRKIFVCMSDWFFLLV